MKVQVMAKSERTNGDYTDCMGDEHFELLGDYQDPDEANEIEDATCMQTYEDWNDLSENERNHFISVAQGLHDFMSQYGEKAAKKSEPTIPSRAEFEKKYNTLCRRVGHPGGGFARKSQVIRAYHEYIDHCGLETKPNQDLISYLLKKRAKSHSGVLVVSVLMGPGRFSCPKDCHYCPNQPGVARSYLLREPSVLRGYRNGWDPIRQFNDRARALENNGHTVDKIEIIVLGGTFSFYPKEYAEEFMTGLYFAANTFFAPASRKSLSLEEEMTRNEDAQCRIIGLTVETRPDYVTLSEITRFRKLGVTRVQLGIQHIENEILELVNRECSIEQSKKGIRLLLETGFKVDAHWMPDLPGSTFEKDLEMFKYLFSHKNTELQVDQWKVYPTATVPYTKIKEWYDNGLYTPYAEKNNGELIVELICYIMEHVPYRIRLNRIVRDIPGDYILAGEKRTNLRQEIDRLMKQRGIECRDVRERECKTRTTYDGEAILYVDKFKASGGTEYYFSLENQKRTELFAHLRLRINHDISNNPFPELRYAALIRELHTYGQLVPVCSTNSGKETQHLGAGRRLMDTAESYSRTHGCNKTAVISGIGVRNYYRKLGYKLEGTYMTKSISKSFLWEKLLSKMFNSVVSRVFQLLLSWRMISPGEHVVFTP